MDLPEAVELKKRFGKLTVSELKQELAKVGVERNGVKAVLVERLAMYWASRKEEQAADGNEAGESGTVQVVAGEDLVGAKGLDGGAGGVEDGGQAEVELQGIALGGEEVANQVEMNEVDEEVDEGVEGMDEGVDEGVEVEGEGEEENQGKEDEQGQEGIAENVGGDEVEENDDDVDKGIELGENVTGQELEDEGSNQESSSGKGDEGKDGDQEELQDQDEDHDQSENKETSHDSEIGNDSRPPDNKVAEDENEEKGKEARHIMLITGLTSETTANDLKTFFRKHGKIGRIRIMTNTRVPGSQRFAHITVQSVEELEHFVQTVNGVKLKGKVIRVQKAPDDGSVSSSYEVAVATAAKDEEEEKAKKERGEKGGDQDQDENGSEREKEGEKEAKPSDVIVEGTKAEKNGEKKEKKDQKEEKKADKSRRPEKTGPQHRSRKESHERRRAEEGYRAPRDYRREANARSSEWRRHNQLPSRSQVEITRVQRDRPPMGRGQVSGPRRRSPAHAQLTFEQIREIRDEQRRREYERRKREEERERAADVEKQKRLEYQNYMEFKQLEREREKLRMERERIEREKLELIKLERERQKAEREKIEKEKEELRRAKYEYSYQRPAAVKRPYEEDKERRRIEEPSKKLYTGERHADLKGDGGKLDRYSDSRLYSSHSKEARSRSPIARDPRRDPWGKGIEVGRPKTHTDDRSHRRELDSLKSDRRREDSRSVPGSSELVSRYAAEASSSRALPPAKRYDDGRSSTRETEWLTRSSYLGPSSSLSLPLSSTSAASRESWPIAERKLEAWDTSRLAPRTEPWISGGATVASQGRSSLPVQAPPPPIYSHTSAALPLASSSLALGRYGADRYEAYKASSYLNRFQ